MYYLSLHSPPTISFGTQSLHDALPNSLGSPIAMAANTEYIVSVTTPPNNFFVVTHGSVALPLDSSHQRTLYGAIGLFETVGTFPTQSYDSSNYFRDLVFVPGSGTGDTV